MAAITDAAGNTTSYTYYGNGTVGAGWLHQETNALGQTTFHQYDLLGRETYTWGSATYPVAQGYDAYGQLNLLRTFRDINANFAGTNFPMGANGDTTTWTYDEATGVLLQKTYADGAGPKYTYYADGLLKTRTWARKDANNNPLTTTYTYTPKGELAQVDYSDATPDVSYTYNALGQQTSITDGAGTRTFSYDPTSLNLVAENFAGTVNGTLHRTHDAYNRSTGYALANGAGDDLLTAATYGYDNRGRFSQVNGETVPTGAPSIAHSLSPLTGPFTYARVTNSDLIGTVTGPAHTVTNTYETNRDILLSKENATLSNSIVSQFAYSVNPIGQRTSRTQTGIAFTAPSTDTFSYNDRGEVIGSISSLNSVLDRTYAYDPIGNRLTATEGTETKSYTANGLNQYTEISTFSPEPLASNLTYDDDGNMLTDGEGKTYTWDGENRLIEVALPNSEIVRYAYDGQSRRVKREHLSTAATETTTYLYDGWNVIAETKQIGSSDPELKTHIWGLDLSDDLQGAGGVGGLLASIARDSSPAVAYFTYDGNGNVSELLDGQGSIKAHYEYDAFGKETLAVGAWAQENTYRFSTKPWDPVTDLNYYGYRFYQSKKGRWINRDPVEEDGGNSLYVFVNNDGVSGIDVLGLQSPKDFLIQSIQGGFSKELFRIPMGPGSIVMTVSFQGKAFKCCNKNTKKYEKWASAQGSVELFYQIGYSIKPKPDPVKGRDRNKKVPHPCKRGEMVKLKYYYREMLECLRRQAGSGGDMTAGLFFPIQCPDADGLQFSGELFVRGTAGVGAGVSISVSYALNPDSLLSWGNFGASVNAGWVGWGASVDAGGGGSGEYLWSLE
mgnify:CR=1 FL=1